MARVTLKSMRRNVSVAVANPRLALRALRVAHPTDAIDIGLDEIAAHVPARSVIIEAGANDGTDTLRMAARWPEATIYAFEPVPEVFEVLEQRVAHLPNVHPQQIALGESDGTATIHLSAMATTPERVSGSSSLLAPSNHVGLFPEIVFTGTTDVPVRTLDSWAAETGVGRIDFAWLDMQGLEVPMLAAAPRMLTTMGAAMLEVARTELYAGSPTYRAVRRFMSAAGFTMAIDRVAEPFGNALFVRRGPGR